VWLDGLITWRAFEDRIARIANGLAATELGPEDRIAVMADNVPQFVEMIAGCVRVGVMTVPINGHCTAPKTSYVLGQTAAEAGVNKVLIFDDRFEDWRHAKSLVEPANTLSLGPMFCTSDTAGRPAQGVASDLSAFSWRGG
jgi:acyl-CoA synthetase (AMP-forming)/AMP-acid ligase II